MKNKKAFTLTEIMLTIAVIGVVAAITIPVMYRDILKTKYITGGKKVFSSYTIFLKKIAADKECENDLRCTGIFGSGTNNQTLGDELTKYMKIEKKCGISTDQNCWPSGTNDNFDGSSATIKNFNTDPNFYKYKTVDGMSFAIHNYTSDYNPDCNNNGSSGLLGSESYLVQTCAIIYVDTNGQVPPNTLGKDTFIFYITNGKGPQLYPAGGKDDKVSGDFDYWNYNNQNRCSKTGSKEGKYCTGRLVENGWEMDYFD